jgi:integrase
MIGYAVDDGLLDVNPLARSQWMAPEAVQTVDPDVVINHDQARLLLTAVGRQGEMGQRLVAFFGCMYYSALRPSETVPLTDAAMQLPRGLGRVPSSRVHSAVWSQVVGDRPVAGPAPAEAPAARRRPRRAHPAAADRPAPPSPA